MKDDMDVIHLVFFSRKYPENLFSASEKGNSSKDLISGHRLTFIFLRDRYGSFLTFFHSQIEPWYIRKSDFESICLLFAYVCRNMHTNIFLPFLKKFLLTPSLSLADVSNSLFCVFLPFSYGISKQKISGEFRQLCEKFCVSFAKICEKMISKVDHFELNISISP